MPQSFFQKTKKYIAGLAILMMMAVMLVSPNAARAQAPTVVTDPGYTAERAVAKIQSGIKSSLSFVFFQAVMNSVNYFLQKAAYDTAVWVASGGKAKVPLFDQRTVGKYLEDTSLDAAGEFIGTFSKAGLWQNLGLDLCTPTLPEIKLKINLGAINQLEPKPKCTFNQIKSNYAHLAATLENGELLNRVGVQFTGGSESDLGTALAFNIGLQQHITDKATTAQLDRLINKGYQAVTTAFSDKITTPADVVEQYAKQNVKNPQAEAEFNATQAFLNKDVLLGSLQLVSNMFIKTLAGKLMQRVQNGFFSINDITGNTKKSLSDIVSSFGSSSQDTTKTAQTLYADLLEPRILDVSQYNPLNEFANCPEEFRGKTFKTINSCVLDQSFLQAIAQNLTIRQAVDQGLLNGNWALIPPSASQDATCYTNAFCSGNLAKLRKLRVIPVGFELAAEVAGNVAGSNGKPVTLNEVLAGFNVQASPFYHLLDENWILKYPETECRIQGYGATLAGWDASEREETCVDTPSCLSTDSSGKCTGGFGYCTREKNIWNINGDQCPAQFASCRVYTRTAGEQVSYLSNTLDSNACTPANAGCLAYRTSQDLTGNWSTGQKLFLNGNAETCDLGLAGCSKLVRADSVPDSNLFLNGGFEEDANLDGIPDNWTIGTAQYVQNNALAYEGNASMQLSADDTIGHDQVPVLSNDLYTLMFASSRVGSTPLSNGPEVKISFFDAAGANMGNVQKTFLIDQSYRTLTMPITTPPTAAKMQIWVIDASGSDIRVDGFILTHGDSYGDVQFAYLKKAPDYLGCTGESGERQECAQYASVCKKSEVGCNLYQPTDGSPNIPGSVTAQDACPTECVGYAAWTQAQSNFENSASDQYFIPSTATSCSAVNVGCSAFTNLSNEKVEYYSAMRACQNSDANTAIFYTWEGSDTTGFQLKTWSLKKDTVTNGPYVINGGLCQQSDMAGNPDCREFQDQSGNKFYRLYSKTVVISADCVAYRKTDFLGASPTNTEEQICTDTGGTFDSVTNGCVYNGLPAENVSCPAAENNCRAYSGTIAGNVRQVFSTDFESGLGGWTGASISNESLVLGGHSLKLPTTPVLKTVPDTQVGMSYTLTFWAKGIAPLTTINVGMFGKIIPVQVSQLWRSYTVGPFIAPATDPSVVVLLQSIASQTFVDNVVLLERQGQTYLLANSWKTPASCDAPVPQAHLGCGEYKVNTQTSGGSNNQNVFLQSFSNLCRPEKVGCTAFIDTKNSPALNAQTWNAVCQLAGAATTDTPCNDANSQLLCTVSAGKNNCRYQTEDAGSLASCSSLSGAGVCRDESTYTNTADSYVYLVDDKSKACSADQAGCMLTGQELTDGTGSTKSVAVKINTDNFDKQLCLSEAVACEEYRTADSVAYFKNPSNKLCEWRDNVNLPGSATPVSGWFKKAIVASDQSGTATITTPEPCNSTRLLDNVYGISRNADSDYTGFAGLCGVENDKCTEFVDPVDTSVDNPNGASYYYINNDKITSGDCAGQVSQKQGCVLFNDTSNLSLIYPAAATYSASQDNQNKKVDPAPCAAGSPCDTNRIIKVHEDRQCGEWLACETKASIWDSGSGRFRDICLSVAPCTKSIVTNNGTVCAEFATQNQGFGQPLSTYLYASRNVNFNGQDYSGYSVPNVYPLGDLSVFNISKNQTPDWRLVKDLGFTCAVDDDGKTCPVSGGDRVGICYKTHCLDYIDGTVPEDLSSDQNKKLFQDINKAPGNICRAYPEKDSPFSNRIIPSGVNQGSRLPGFANATVCGSGNDCECKYQKIDSGSSSHYTSFDKYDITHSGICNGGPDSGRPCTRDTEKDDCHDDLITGEKGYCETMPKYMCQGGLRDGQICLPEVFRCTEGFGQGQSCQPKKYYCVTGPKVVDVNSRIECRPGVKEDCGYTGSSNPTLPYCLPDGGCMKPEDRDDSVVGNKLYQFRDVCQPVSSADCPADSSGNKGTCEKVNKITDYAGLYGRCLERDLSTPISGAANQYACLTWYPTDLSFGGLDIYNLNKAATYVPATDQEKIKDLGYVPADLNYNVVFGPISGRAKDAYPPNPNQNNVIIAAALCAGDACHSGRFNKLAIDGVETTQGVIVPFSQIKTTKLQFYAWTDNDQTPISSVEINWGDEKEEVFNAGYYKNHKPYCNQDDYSADGGASYCQANLTTAEVIDSNYTCATNNDCSLVDISSLASDPSQVVCKKEKVCVTSPGTLCTPDANGNDTIACHGFDWGRCISNKKCYYPNYAGTGPNFENSSSCMVDSECTNYGQGECRPYSSTGDFRCYNLLGSQEKSCTGLNDTVSCASPISATACVDRRFSGSSVRACDPKPFTYLHTYQCPKTSGSCSYSIVVTVIDVTYHNAIVGGTGGGGTGLFIP